MLYWLLKFVLVGPLVRVLCRATISGLENIPQTGGALIASNHLAVSDSVFLPLMVDRRIYFMAKREYFTQPGFRGWCKRHFFTALGQVPVERGSSAARAALDTGNRMLGEGKLFCIYPEGTRSPDGRLFKGKIGVARMALESEVPVIPVAMFGTNKVSPVGARMFRPHKVRIKIGEPLDFSRYFGMANDRFIQRSMTDEIMYALMELSGAEYVDVYAAKVKEDAAAGDEDGPAARLSRTKAS